HDGALRLRVQAGSYCRIALPLCVEEGVIQCRIGESRPVIRAIGGEVAAQKCRIDAEFIPCNEVVLACLHLINQKTPAWNLIQVGADANGAPLILNKLRDFRDQTPRWHNYINADVYPAEIEVAVVIGILITNLSQKCLRLRRIEGISARQFPIVKCGIRGNRSPRDSRKALVHRINDRLAVGGVKQRLPHAHIVCGKTAGIEQKLQWLTGNADRQELNLAVRAQRTSIGRQQFADDLRVASFQCNRACSYILKKAKLDLVYGIFTWWLVKLRTPRVFRIALDNETISRHVFDKTEGSRPYLMELIGVVGVLRQRGRTGNP